MNQTLAKVLYVAGVTTFCTFLGCWAVLAHQENTPTTQKQTTHRGSVAGADEKFAREVSEGGVAEIELGKLAEEKGQSEHVKLFAKHMVEDHTKVNEELKEIASREHLTLLTNLDRKDEGTRQRLEKMSGPEFDKAYAETMVRDHEQDVAAFKQEANSGQKSSLQQFAQRFLPTLEGHLKEAQQVKNFVAQEGSHASKRGGTGSGAPHR